MGPGMRFNFKAGLCAGTKANACPFHMPFRRHPTEPNAPAPDADPGETAAPTRCFLVGTARGGTTLLQSMLGAHPAVFTLPETHFWDYSLPKQPWLRKLKALRPASAGKDRTRVAAFLRGHGLLDGSAHPMADQGAVLNATVQQAVDRLPDKPLSATQAWTQGLFAVLDALAAEAGQRMWLEKTPLHLYYTDLFRAADPSVRIVHMLRDPIDQVASLVDAGTQHGDAFRQGSVAKAWTRWKKEYQLQRRMIGKPGHAFVCYEDLVADPEASLRPLFSFLGLPWNEAVLHFQDKASGVIASGESWKDRNTGALAKSNKAERVLSVVDREWLRRQALKHPLEPFRQAVPVAPLKS